MIYFLKYIILHYIHQIIKLIEKQELNLPEFILL